MDDLRKKAYKELKSIDVPETRDIEAYPGKRPILYVSDFSFSPPTDVWETEQMICVVMEIAALRLEDFMINYRDGFLVIEGERKAPETDQENRVIKYHKKELDYGKFLVKIKMNTRIDKEKISASYKNGLLKVSLPKNVQPTIRHDVEIPVKMK
ncbi:MAG: Hsp20/alpha crystallin family protein [Calditrichia bacterium]|nr:Hsp20/alpha crystallin family protein [Calditrichia bacterium]